jgi:hypothetical protein
MNGRIAWAALAGAALLAGLAPLASARLPRDVPEARFPGWPAAYEGARLTELALSTREAAFTRDFPGRIGRFSDGRREIIVRYLAQPTRRLHPAADCLQAVGFAITPLPARRPAEGHVQGCFRAVLGGDRLRVCEHIMSADGQGWPDVSSWYWSTLFSRGGGPWWSFVVAERE